MILIYNPHVDDFLSIPPHFRLFGRRALRKYGFFFDEAVRNGLDLRILIDASCSAFIPETIFHRLPYWTRRIVSEFEYKLWRKCNTGLGKLIRIQPSMSSSNDVVVVFSYKGATGNFEIRKKLLAQYRAVVFHLSHYFVATAEKARNIKSLDNAYLAGDSDIIKNEYFRKYFSWYLKDFLILPFAVADRFESRTCFSTRRCQCVATGTFHDLQHERPIYKYSDYLESTGYVTYHPIRKKIFDLGVNLPNFIVSYISPYRRSNPESFIVRVVNHFLVSQKTYFAINIVELYNEFQFVVVGEEFSGFPALGAFEAMACGCVLIADPKFYEGLPLIPGKDFICYDGTIEGLFHVLEGLTDRRLSSNTLESVETVRIFFSPAYVYTRWIKTLSELNNV